MTTLLLLFVQLQFVQSVPLEGNTFHVQGVAVDGQRAWVTSVESVSKRGWLFEYELPSGKRLKAVEVTSGTCFHPGGLDQDADSLWIPVAEYTAKGRAVIQKRSKATLELLGSFEVADHIGAVAVAGESLFGANWDAKQIYTWSKDGKELQVRNNPLPVHYQDMKWRYGSLVASGLLEKPKTGGVIHWLDPETLLPLQSIETGTTDRGVAMSREGMDLTPELVYLVPEDNPSRLLIYQIAP